jgi:hypothetical protein
LALAVFVGLFSDGLTYVPADSVLDDFEGRLFTALLPSALVVE